jgi:hypothetical protein
MRRLSQLFTLAAAVVFVLALAWVVLEEVVEYSGGGR